MPRTVKNRRMLSQRLAGLYAAAAVSVVLAGASLFSANASGAAFPGSDRIMPRASISSFHPNGDGARPRLRTFVVTAYCPCAKCCGRWARDHGSARKLASGERLLEAGKFFVAAPPGMDFGTRVCVPGYAGGRPVPVLDRGGEITGNRLDVFFRSHNQAQQWGCRRLPVAIAPSDQ